MQSVHPLPNVAPAETSDRTEDGRQSGASRRAVAEGVTRPGLGAKRPETLRATGARVVAAMILVLLAGGLVARSGKAVRQDAPSPAAKLEPVWLFANAQRQRRLGDARRAEQLEMYLLESYPDSPEAKRLKTHVLAGRTPGKAPASAVP